MGRKKKHIRRQNGEGSFYFDKSRNRFRYTVTLYNDYGPIGKKQFYGNSKSMCEQKAEEYLKKHSATDNPLLLDYTIVDILEEYIEDQLSFNEIGENTYVSKIQILNIIKDAPISKVKIVDLNERQIKTFLKSIVGYSQSVIDKVYSQLKKALTLAKQKRIIDESIIEFYQIRKPKSNIKTKKVEAFTVPEQRRLLDALDNYKPRKNRGYYKNQFIIMLYTGMRAGEVNALKVSDIDFETKKIHINRTLTRNKNGKTILGDTTKTYNSLRDVIMTKEVESALKDAISNMKKNKNDLIFTNTRGGLVSHTATNDALHRLCEKNDLPLYGQHSLRHTFATRCIEAGVTAVVLSKWLGHKDIQTTLNTYVDVFNAQNNEQFDLFAQSVEKIRNTDITALKD